MAISHKNHGLTPLEKCQFLDFFLSSCFYSIERRFFVLEYRKTHLSWPILPNKNRCKNGNFGPKPWTNPFGKMSIFRFFKPLVFIT